jgi:ATP-dependent Zn protease
MVLQYGMGRQTIYPDMSDKSKYLIDQEINALLFEAHSRAFNILTTVKNLIVDCKEILKKNKILKPDNIIDIINLKYPEIWEIYKIDVKNNY